MRLPSALMRGPVSPRGPVRIGAGVAAAGLVAGSAAFAAVRTADAPDFASTLVAMHSAKCLTALDGGGGGARSGSRLVQQACADAPTQRFEFRRAGGTGGAFEIRNAGTGYCVDVRGAGSADGAPVVQWSECHGRANQRFTLRPVAGYRGAYLVVARSSGKCLDVRGAAQEDGTPVVQWRCGDAATAGHEIWRVDVPLTVVPQAAATGPGLGTASAPAPGGDRPGTGAGHDGPATGPADRPGGASNPEWGRSAPPAGAPLSRAYQVILRDDPHGYTPRSGECTREVHARYWTWGPDGRVYPTWHPPRDPSGCAFGHEHGDDPRTSVLFATVGFIPFGYANEQLAPSDPASRRDEDHVGHKIGAGDGVPVRATNASDSPVVATCDALQMMHQGLHSPDAFTNNLHQMSYNVRCRYLDDGGTIETRFTALVPVGQPGGFSVSEQCASETHKRRDGVGAVTPADSPTGTGDRFIADAVCASEIVAGDGDINRINELWVYGALASNAGQLKRFEIVTFLFSSNPARYYDPAAPGRTGYTVDLCYRGASGFQCDQVRRLTERTGQKITYDDPRSPFNGAARLMSPDHLVIQNTGPSTVYTDVFGKRFSATPFPGAIRQYIAGNHAYDQHQGAINLQFRNYAGNTADGVHAPN